MNEQTIKTKAVSYCRVSSKEQEETGYSLPAQEKLLIDYAERRDKNFQIVKVFSVAESASGAKQRKVFSEMMDYMRRNKIPALMCEKVDRLTRNLKEAVMVNDWLEEDESRSIHFVKQNLVIHKDSKSHEWFMWRVKVATAEYYIRLLSENVKKGQKEKLAQGWIPTRAKLGYKTIGEKGHKIHVIDSWTTDKDSNKVLTGDAAHMKNMFDWYATGNYSVARLEKELYEGGFRTRSGGKLGMSRIHMLLQDPFFYGMNLWNGKITKGGHEPLISKDVFDKVQKNLKRQTKNPHLAKHNPLFKSKIFCENCGGMLTWYIKKGHWYGHCNNHGEYAKCSKKTCIRQERVEEQYTDVFDIIAPKSEAVLVEIENILREEHAGRKTEKDKELTRLNGLLSAVRQQKDKYFEAKINREVPLEYCEKKIAECTKEEDALENALSLVSNKHDEYLQLGLAVHELAYKSKEIYEKATIDEKRLLLSQLFTNLVQNGLKIKPIYTEAAEILVNWMPRLNSDYELAKSQATKGKNAVLVASSPNWLPLQNALRTFDWRVMREEMNDLNFIKSS